MHPMPRTQTEIKKMPTAQVPGTNVMIEKVVPKRVMMIELEDGEDAIEDELLDLCNKHELHREFTQRSLDSIQKEVKHRQVGKRGPTPLEGTDYMCRGCGNLLPDGCDCNKKDWALNDDKFDALEKVQGSVDKMRMKILQISEDDLMNITHDKLMENVDECFPAHKRKSFGVDDERKKLLKTVGIDVDRSDHGKFH